MKLRRKSGVWGCSCRIVTATAALIVSSGLPVTPALAAKPSISDPAYSVLAQRVTTNQTSFYVYLDQDAGSNHGFPSGFFASNQDNLNTIHIDTGCIDALDVGDPNPTNGCSQNSNVLDQIRGTVMRITFDSQVQMNFAGVNIEEPENYGVLNGEGLCLVNGVNNCTPYDWRCFT